MRDESEEMANLVAPTPSERPSAEASNPIIIRSLIPIVFVGFLIAFSALFLLQWPLPAGSDQSTDLLLRRITSPAVTEGTANVARRFLDLGIFIITLIGIGFMTVAWRMGERGPLIGLVAVGILGIAYASGTAAYTGPLVSVCGYTIILFGGLVAWLAASSDTSSELTEQPDRSTKAKTEATERRTNDNADNASHSVA
jgi:hypothetical protein